MVNSLTVKVKPWLSRWNLDSWSDDLKVLFYHIVRFQNFEEKFDNVLAKLLYTHSSSISGLLQIDDLFIIPQPTFKLLLE